MIDKIMRYLSIFLLLGIMIIFSGEKYLFAQEIYKVLEADTRGIFGLNLDSSESFLSPDISSGLLSVSRIRFYSTSSFDDIYRERTADYTTKISKFTQLSRLEMPINQGRSGAAIRIEYGYSSSYAYKKSISDQEYLVEKKLERYALGAGRQFFTNRLDLSGSIGSSNVLDKMKQDYTMNIQLHPSEKYSLMSSIKSRWNSLNMALNAEDEKLSVNSISTNDVWAVGFEVMPKDYILINMKYERGETNAGGESDMFEGYRFEPNSQSTLMNGNITFQSNDRFKLNMSYTAFQTDGKITLMRRDLRKGKMTRFNFDENDFELKASLLSAKNSVATFEYGRYGINGNQKGHIESSIIPSPLLVLLGTRFNYRGGMEADMTRVRLGYISGHGRKLIIEANLGYIWFNPDFDLRSWQSEILVFGLRDFQQRSLNFNELQAVIPEIHIGFNTGLIGIKYAFAQAIPTVIRGAGSTDQGNKSSTSNAVYSQYGGGFHILEISIYP